MPKSTQTGHNISASDLKPSKCHERTEEKSLDTGLGNDLTDLTAKAQAIRQITVKSFFMAQQLRQHK